MNFRRKFYLSVLGDNVTCTYFFIITKSSIEDNCIICYESIDESIICNECNQSFHLDCIVKWFKQNIKRICPHCRCSWKFVVIINESNYSIETKGTLSGTLLHFD